MTNSPSSTNYDVIIIGSGPSGIFTAYEIRKKDPSARVLMIEKGQIDRKSQMPQTQNRRLCQLPPLCHHNRVLRRWQLQRWQTLHQLRR